MNDVQPQRRVWLAFLTAVPIGMLGGMIGLGGAEFRLPVLAGPLGYTARKAVPLNLAVSLVTVLTAFITRSRILPWQPLEALSHILPAMTAGAVLAAFFGAGLAQRVSNVRLERLILALLVAIGVALIGESFLGRQGAGLPFSGALLQAAAAFGCGLAIGLVSSLLGVAGGEVIIPTLIFVFGVQVKLAGSASLLVSLPTILMGIVRYARNSALYDRASFNSTILPMAAGSVIGAVAGGLLSGIIPAEILKFCLGCILIWSAWHIFQPKRESLEKCS